MVTFLMFIGTSWTYRVLKIKWKNSIKYDKYKGRKNFQYLLPIQRIMKERERERGENVKLMINCDNHENDKLIFAKIN